MEQKKGMCADARCRQDTDGLAGMLSKGLIHSDPLDLLLAAELGR